MDALQWLTKELETADAEFTRVAVEIKKATYGRGPLRQERDYWNGYKDAITNALNEIAGPGDVA